MCVPGSTAAECPAPAAVVDPIRWADDSEVVVYTSAKGALVLAVSVTPDDRVLLGPTPVDLSASRAALHASSAEAIWQVASVLDGLLQPANQPGVAPDALAVSWIRIHDILVFREDMQTVAAHVYSAECINPQCLVTLYVGASGLAAPRTDWRRDERAA